MSGQPSICMPLAIEWFVVRAAIMDQPKPRSAQQARHEAIRFAFGAASAPLRPAS